VRAARFALCVCVRVCVCVHVCSMFGVHLLKHYSCVVCVSLLEPRDLHARTHACPHARTHERTHARTRSRTHVNSPDKFGRFSQSTFTMFQVAVPSGGTLLGSFALSCSWISSGLCLYSSSGLIGVMYHFLSLSFSLSLSGTERVCVRIQT
jgi:hypothetical protein